MISGWKARYLARYDRAPLRTSLLGMAGLGLGGLLLGLVLLGLDLVFGADAFVMLAVFLLVGLLALRPLLLVVSLSAEALWVATGLYRLLGVQGRPLRARYEAPSSS